MDRNEGRLALVTKNVRESYPIRVAGPGHGHSEEATSGKRGKGRGGRKGWEGEKDMSASSIDRSTASD